MRQDDFLEVIKELVPLMIEQATESRKLDQQMEHEHGTKRSVSPEPSDQLPEAPAVCVRAEEDDALLLL